MILEKHSAVFFRFSYNVYTLSILTLYFTTFLFLHVSAFGPLSFTKDIDQLLIFFDFLAL